MSVPTTHTAPAVGAAAGGDDGKAAPDSATEEPAWELPRGPLGPRVGVSSGAGLSHGCFLSAVDPGRGRGTLLGACRAVTTAGLVSIGFGKGGGGMCSVGSEK